MGNEDLVPLGETDFVTRKQQRLCYQSEQPNAVFRNLYQLLETPHWIRTALHRVLQNRGSRTPGVDGFTAMHLGDSAAREQLVQDIVADMRAHAYHPQPVRRISIPKHSDPSKLRPLGIPTIRDRCVQEAVRMILEPLYEPRFYSHSYGFRPFRSAHHGRRVQQPSDAVILDALSDLDMQKYVDAQASWYQWSAVLPYQRRIIEALDVPIDRRFVWDPSG